MFQDDQREKRPWTWSWPAIIAVVIFALAGIQILRVNRPASPTGPANESRTYTADGPLVTGDIAIAAKDYYAHRIELNRRAKLSGNFKTTALRNSVSAAVVDESNFELWKSSGDVNPVTQTGYVPGGKINQVLEPGNYFLIIDNRRNETAQSVYANFVLE